MSNIKKALSIVLVLVMLISFAACGDKKDVEDMSDEEIEEIFEDIEGENFEEETVNNSTSSNKIGLDAIMFSMDFENYNGYGFLNISQNWRDVIPYYVSYESLENYLKSTNPMILVNYPNGCDFNDIIEYAPAEDYNRLSNGDTVYINAKITDEFATYGITVDGLKRALCIDFDSTLVYTVADLPEGGIPVDIFTPIEQYIVYEGANGNIEAKIELPDDFYFENSGYYFTAYGNDGDMSVIYNNETIITYEYEVESGTFSSGDKVTIGCGTVYIDGGWHSLVDVFMTKGLCMVDAYKEVFVPDVGSFVSSVDQLSMDRIEFIKQSTFSNLQSINEGDNCEFRGIYAGNLKPTVGSDNGSTFAAYVVYRAPYDDFFGEYTEIFTIVPVTDIILRPDGKIEFTEATIFDIKKVNTEAEVQEFFNNCPYSCTKIG